VNRDVFDRKSILRVLMKGGGGLARRPRSFLPPHEDDEVTGTGHANPSVTEDIRLRPMITMDIKASASG
jgi:hypothetical protein